MNVKEWHVHFVSKNEVMILHCFLNKQLSTQTKAAPVILILTLLQFTQHSSDGAKSK